MLYQCYCFNYTCIVFFLDENLLFTSFSHPFRFFPFSIHNRMYSTWTYWGWLFSLLLLVTLSLSVWNMWSCQQHHCYLWYLGRGSFFWPVWQNCFRTLDSASLSRLWNRRAPYRTGRSLQVSSPGIF